MMGMRASPYGMRSSQICDNCFQPGHLAQGCPMERSCHACGSYAHSKKDCPNTNKLCDLCGRVGHLKFKCRLAQSQFGSNMFATNYNVGFSGGAKKPCDNCGALGHLAAQCPSPQQCHCCGSVSHTKAQCTKIGAQCDLCGKIGHLKAKCRQFY